MRKLLPILTGFLLLGVGPTRADEGGICGLGGMVVSLPPPYRPDSVVRERTSSPVPHAASTTEVLCTFAEPGGANVHLLLWRGDFPKDRGVSETRWQRPVSLGTLRCEAVGAVRFMGVRQNVTAAFCRLRGRGGLTIYSSDLEPERFLELLKRISVRTH